jgi:hypothetical protein
MNLNATLILILFWAGFLVGLWWLKRAASRFFLAKASVTWPATEGKITASKIEEVRGNRGTAYHARIRFSYAIQGKAFSANTPKYGYYHDYGNVRILTKKYPKGSKAQVFYDPENPSNAVLEPGYSHAITVELIVIVALLGIWLFAGMHL